MGPAFIDFDPDEAGRFRFIAVDGHMDCRYGDRDGRPAVDFTWEGHDECDTANGRGWAVLDDDGTLIGHISFIAATIRPSRRFAARAPLDQPHRQCY